MQGQPLSPELISTVAGILLSLGFSYIPSLAGWFNRLGEHPFPCWRSLPTEEGHRQAIFLPRQAIFLPRQAIFLPRDGGQDVNCSSLVSEERAPLPCHGVCDAGWGPGCELFLTRFRGTSSIPPELFLSLFRGTTPLPSPEPYHRCTPLLPWWDKGIDQRSLLVRDEGESFLFVFFEEPIPPLLANLNS